MSPNSEKIKVLPSTPAPGRLPTWSEIDELIAEEREVKAELRRGTPVSEIVKKLNARAAAKPSSPPPAKIVVGPTKVSGGDVARVIELPNGGGRLEIWEYGKGRVDGKGKVTPDELMPGAGKPVSANDAARLGIPISEFESWAGLVTEFDHYYQRYRHRLLVERLRLGLRIDPAHGLICL